MHTKPTCAWHPRSSRVRISLVDLAALIARSSLLFIAMALACVTCGAATPAGAAPIEAAKLERIEGSDLQRVRLTQRASERLGIETAPVREAQVARRAAPTAAATSRLVVPYSAVVYDLRGDTWAYVSTEPLVYQRHALRVDYIEGDLAVLLEGPPVGTAVVTVGVAELFGIELGVGK